MHETQKPTWYSTQPLVIIKKKNASYSEIFLNLITGQILVFGDLLYNSLISDNLLRGDKNGEIHKTDETQVLK